MQSAYMHLRPSKYRSGRRGAGKGSFYHGTGHCGHNWYLGQYTKGKPKPPKSGAPVMPLPPVTQVDFAPAVPGASNVSRAAVAQQRKAAHRKACRAARRARK